MDYNRQKKCSKKSYKRTYIGDMQEENGVYFKLIMIKMVITNKIHLENKQNAMASGVFFIPSIVAAALMCIPSFWRRAELRNQKR